MALGKGTSLESEVRKTFAILNLNKDKSPPSRVVRSGLSYLAPLFATIFAIGVFWPSTLNPFKENVNLLNYVNDTTIVVLDSSAVLNPANDATLVVSESLNVKKSIALYERPVLDKQSYLYDSVFSNDVIVDSIQILDSLVAITENELLQEKSDNVFDSLLNDYISSLPFTVLPASNTVRVIDNHYGFEGCYKINFMEIESSIIQQKNYFRSSRQKDFSFEVDFSEIHSNLFVRVYNIMNKKFPVDVVFPEYYSSGLVFPIDSLRDIRDDIRLLELLDTVSRADNSTFSEFPLYNISSNYDLSKGNYLAEKNIVIAEDATLSVAPGSTIYLTSNNEIQVNGRIIAEGTKDEHIVFSSSSVGEDDSWGGLLFRTKELSFFRFCKFGDSRLGSLKNGDFVAVRHTRHFALKNSFLYNGICAEYNLLYDANIFGNDPIGVDAWSQIK